MGSVVARGTGVGRAGAQARISVRVMNQKDNLVRGVVIDKLNYQGFIWDVQVVILMSLREGLSPTTLAHARSAGEQSHV